MPQQGLAPGIASRPDELADGLAGREILIIVSTAYMDEAERCARVHLLEGGRLLAAGEPRAVLRERGAASFEEIFIRGAAK